MADVYRIEKETEDEGGQYAIIGLNGTTVIGLYDTLKAAKLGEGVLRAAARQRRLKREAANARR